MNKKVLDLTEQSQLFTVNRGTPTIDTFRLMDRSKLSAIPIVDEDDKLIGNISARDLKLFIESHLSYDVLNLPVMQFLNKLRDENINIKAPVMCCFPSDSIRTVVAKLCATKVHRLYVVKSPTDLTPISVLSLSDVLKKFSTM